MNQNNIKVDIPKEKRDAMLLDALWIIQNLRRYKILWERHYGSQHRNRLRVWEDKADKLLTQLEINTNNDTE